MSDLQMRRADQSRDEQIAKTAKTAKVDAAASTHEADSIEGADHAYDAAVSEEHAGSAPGHRLAVAEPPVTAEADAAPDPMVTPLPHPSLGEQATAMLARAGQRLGAMTPEQWAWVAVLTLAAVLRFWGLGDRPLHHDESMHAYFSLAFAQDPSSYAYNPLLHGPFQFHAEGFMFWLLLGLQSVFAHGAVGNPWINDTTARFVPALFGIGIVLLPLGLRRELGRLGALIAAFLLAVSPAFVYFSRFLREDVYFNFFMFAMVVCAVRFARSRSTRAFVGLAAATILAYSTFEGVFLTLTVFVGFMALLAVWELATPLADRLPATFTSRERAFLARAGLFALLGAVAAVIAKIGLQKLNELSDFVTNKNYQNAADLAVRQLEDNSVGVLIFVSFVIALLVIGTVIWQMYRDDAYDRHATQMGNMPGDISTESVERIARLDDLLTAPARAVVRLRERLDPETQPFLRTLLSVSWINAFIAFVVAFMLFAILFFIVPGTSSSTSQVATLGDGFRIGIGKGIWQGLYYWLQQQHVARGGQPWYYYLMLLPMYEQLVCFFGVVGIVYCLLRPGRFRLFLAWWFLGSLALYSWAGEKMPWLTIQILLPLVLLAAIVLARLVGVCAAVIERLAANDTAGLRAAPLKPALSVVGTALALLLLVPMLYGMLTLTQVDAANAPHEMMVYVQTTKDVQLVMDKIKAADQKLYGGKHLLRIGVGDGMEWPWYWYLRDYKYSYFGYRASDEKQYPPMDVIIAMPSGSSIGTDGQTWAASHPTGWQMHQYQLRSWWSEDYKPKPCVATKGHPCSDSSQFVVYGVGLGAYLTYGRAPQPGQPDFVFGKAVGRIWDWLWTRKAFGYTDGSTDFVFIVRDGLPITAKP